MYTSPATIPAAEEPSPMPDPAIHDAPATHLQLIRLASRTFAAYLLFWVVVDATSLPREILDIVHELQGPGAWGYSVLSAFKASFYVRTYILYLTENILRIALWLMAAGWFYRCGPRIQRFFNPENETPETLLSPETT